MPEADAHQFSVWAHVAPCLGQLPAPREPGGRAPHSRHSEATAISEQGGHDSAAGLLIWPGAGQAVMYMGRDTQEVETTGSP